MVEALSQPQDNYDPEVTLVKEICDTLQLQIVPKISKLCTIRMQKADT